MNRWNDAPSNTAWCWNLSFNGQLAGWDGIPLKPKPFGLGAVTALWSSLPPVSASFNAWCEHPRCAWGLWAGQCLRLAPCLLLLPKDEHNSSQRGQPYG